MRLCSWLMSGYSSTCEKDVLENQAKVEERRDVLEKTGRAEKRILPDPTGQS